MAPIRSRLMAGCSGRLRAHRGHRLLQHLHTLSAGANPLFQTWGILPLCPYTSQKPLPLKPRSHAAAAPSPVPAHATGLASAASSHLDTAVLSPSLRVSSSSPPACPGVADVTRGQAGGCRHPWGGNPEETRGGLGCAERPASCSVLAGLQFSEALLT